MWNKDGVACLYPPDQSLTLREQFEAQEAEMERYYGVWERSPERLAAIAAGESWNEQQARRLREIDARLGGGEIAKHWHALMFSTLPCSAGLVCNDLRFAPSPQFAELQYMLERDADARSRLHRIASGLGSKFYKTEWWAPTSSEQLRRQPFCVECFPGVVWGHELTQVGNKRVMSFWLRDGGLLIDYQRWLPLQAHHTTYYRDRVNIFGLEPLYMDVLVTLCSKHHGENHGKGL